MVVACTCRRPGKRGRPAGENLLEPEPLGVCEMLDHAQRRPSAWHADLPDAVVVEALDNLQYAVTLGLQERREGGAAGMMSHARPFARSW